MSNTKNCIDCKNEFPIDEFYSSKQHRPNDKIYLAYSSRCKKCDINFNRERFDKSYKQKISIRFNHTKSRCKDNGTEFTITKEDVINQYENQQGKCYYSGRVLSYKTKDENVMSIDRINPKIGYTKENIVICCWRINRMKLNYGVKDFLKLCEDICVHNKISTEN